jgi:hypothetical protein
MCACGGGTCGGGTCGGRDALAELHAKIMEIDDMQNVGLETLRLRRQTKGFVPVYGENGDWALRAKLKTLADRRQKLLDELCSADPNSPLCRRR